MLTEVRGFQVMGDYLYAVSGDLLIRIDSSYSVTTLNNSDRMATKTGPVTMADNGIQLMIADGSCSAYLYDSQTDVFTKLTEETYGFMGGGCVTFQDGFFISHQPDSDTFYHCALNDGLSWDVLDNNQALVKPGNIVRQLSNHRELWTFKKKSTEIFYNSGDNEIVFQRMPGGNLEIGLGAIHSVALLDNTLFWLANDKTVRMAAGYVPAIVSTPQLSYRIEKFSVVSDAIGFGFVFEGHSFYQLTFPSEGVTFVYDAATKMWHEKTSYRVGTEDDSRHRANCYAKFNDEHIVGDYSNGKIYKFDSDAFTDAGNRIQRTRVIRLLDAEEKPIFLHNFQIDFEAGVGITTGQGSDPKAMLQISKDGGHSYGNELWADIGPKGKFNQRAIWWRLGRSRDPVAKLVMTDPIKVVIVGAYLDANPGV